MDDSPKKSPGFYRRFYEEHRIQNSENAASTGPSLPTLDMKQIRTRGRVPSLKKTKVSRILTDEQAGSAKNPITVNTDSESDHGDSIDRTAMQDSEESGDDHDSFLPSIYHRTTTMDTTLPVKQELSMESDDDHSILSLPWDTRSKDQDSNERGDYHSLQSQNSRCELHGEIMTECLMCGLEQSVRSSRIGEQHEATLYSSVDTLLAEEGLSRISCAADGHCLVSAWSLQTGTDNKTLLSALESEILKNFEFYKSFISKQNNLREYLNNFLYKKQYESEVGDIVLNALCNMSHKVVVVFEYCQDGRLRKCHVKPRSGKKLGQPVLLVKTGRHYDAARRTDVNNKEVTLVQAISDDADDECVLPLYKEDPRMPIFSKEKKSYKTFEVLNLLVNNPPSYLCKSLPYLVQDNLTFALSVAPGDIPFQDIQCDGHSGWTNDGVRPSTYHWNGTSFVLLHSGKPNKLSAGDFVVYRKYFTHRHSRDLKKNIMYIHNDAGQIVNNVVLVQYFFVGERHGVNVQKHGNSVKSSHYYCKTKPSVLSKLKEKCLTMPTTRAVSTIIEENGGVCAATSPADIPNCNQLYNYKVRTGAAFRGPTVDDEVQALYDLAGGEYAYYVRDVHERLGDVHERHGLVAVLTTDSQLRDIERFCCSDVDFFPVTIDPTFKLGRFHVTPITYRNLLLSTDPERESPPIMVGPILIHFSKTELVYSTFFEELIRLHPPLRNLKAFGTDGESSLFKAASRAFPDAIHLRCFRHFQQNVELKLKNLGLGVDVKKYIEEIIHGDASLLSSESNEEFQTRFEQLRYQWLLRDPSGQFVEFMRGRMDMMKECMIAPVRTKAGLGLPPANFYSNDSESVNHRLKNWVQFKESTMPVFTKHMASLVQAQEENVKKAVTNTRGNYHVRRVFQKQLVNDNFFELSAKQKEQFFNKVENISLSELHSNSGCNSARINFDLANSPLLSVKYDETGISVSKYVLQEIWVKAAGLLQNWDSVCSVAPGSTDSCSRFCILNTVHANDKVHIVTWTHPETFSCPCYSYKVHAVCAHTVACSERNDSLSMVRILCQ